MQCSFMEFRGYKIIYRRYASLFFIVGADQDDEVACSSICSHATKNCDFQVLVLRNIISLAQYVYARMYYIYCVHRLAGRIGGCYSCSGVCSSLFLDQLLEVGARTHYHTQRHYSCPSTTRTYAERIGHFGIYPQSRGNVRQIL